jgi:4-hydroxy-tetrahydrodipicolinate synthase
MTQMENLNGSVVAIVTPFDVQENIDFEAYGRLIDFHLENETSGIVVAGTTGESVALTEEEFVALVKFTVQRVNGQIPVIAGTGSNVTRKAIHYSKLAQQNGADGLLVINPYYNKPGVEGTYEYFKAVVTATEIPVILYNVPGRTGSNMSADLVLRLAVEFNRVIGVKEASGDLNQVMEIINNRPEGFKVFSGDDALAYAIVALGGDGCISVAANQIPREFNTMLTHALTGEMEEARQLHYKYLNLMHLNFVESNPVPVKTALHWMGLIENQYRSPIFPMQNARNKMLLRSELMGLGLIEENQYEQITTER